MYSVSEASAHTKKLMSFQTLFHYGSDVTLPKRQRWHCAVGISLAFDQFDLVLHEPWRAGGHCRCQLVEFPNRLPLTWRAGRSLYSQPWRFHLHAALLCRFPPGQVHHVSMPSPPSRLPSRWVAEHGGSTPSTIVPRPDTLQVSRSSTCYFQEVAPMSRKNEDASMASLLLMRHSKGRCTTSAIHPRARFPGADFALEEVGWVS